MSTKVGQIHLQADWLRKLAMTTAYELLCMDDLRVAFSTVESGVHLDHPGVFQIVDMVGLCSVVG